MADDVTLPNDDDPQPSPTARPTKSTMPALGQTQGKRSAEIVAALRRITTETELSTALASMGGTIAVRFLLNFMTDRLGSTAGYITARDAIYEHVIVRFIDKNGLQGPIVADIASGFSPLAYKLAKRFKNGTFYDVDLEDVVAAKKQRLSSLEGGLPANWHPVGVDLGTVPLDKALPQTPHVISSAGLHPYFEPDLVRQVIAGAHDFLRPGGMYLSDMGREGVLGTVETNATRMFNRQAGRFKCLITTKDEAAAYYEAFDTVRVHDAHDLESTIATIPKDVTVFTYIVEALKAKEA